MTTDGRISYKDIPISKLTDSDLAEMLANDVKADGYNKLRAEIADRWVQIYRVFDDVGTEVTVRQMFYQCEVRGAVEKSESGYDKIQSQMVRMRKLGYLPYDWVTDNTRSVRKPETYKSLDSFAKHHAEHYRRDLWRNQPDHVEIWIEKEAIMGIADAVTNDYDVPLYPSKGYASLSLTATAAEQIKYIKENEGKEVYIYYLGDYDPSGEDIPRAIQKHLREMGADFHFIHLAVNPEQIEKYNLPTRPTKKSDSRSKKFSGGNVSVEVDALRPDVLKRLIREAIEKHIDPVQLEWTRRIEEYERETLINTFGKLQASHTFSQEA